MLCLCAYVPFLAEKRQGGYWWIFDNLVTPLHNWHCFGHINLYKVSPEAAFYLAPKKETRPNKTIDCLIFLLYRFAEVL